MVINTKSDLARQDLRRLWLTLGAIETLDKPTLSMLASTLKMQMSTLQRVIERLNSEQIPGLTVSVSGGVYFVASWGVLDKEYIVKFFVSHLSDYA